MKKAIFLMGPTAIGKTALACQLSDQFPLHLISVDSALIYRGMDIGTGKPEPFELERYPHAFINICEPKDHFSVGDFLVLAKKEVEHAFTIGKIPLFVGGTMLYFKALKDGLSALPQTELAVRHALEGALAQEGLASLYGRLEKIDPEMAAKLHPEDTQRIVRALEIYLQTGKTMSHYLARSERELGLAVPIVTLALVPSQRAWLHQRIESRFKEMLHNGLIEEVERLLQQVSLSANVFRSVGYRQVLLYLQGKINKEEMLQQGIAATRQLAKRQLTWIRHWGVATELTVPDEQLLEKTTYLLMKEIQVR